MLRFLIFVCLLFHMGLKRILLLVKKWVIAEKLRDLESAYVAENRGDSAVIQACFLCEITSAVFCA